MQKVLFIDAYNMLYRSRSGWTSGENPIVYTFFRSLRSVLNKFNPDRAYFVLEGYPKKRMQIDSSYKGQRVREPDEEWSRQKKMCIQIVSENTPVVSVRHAEREADDVIAHLALVDHADDECIVVSSDKDFILLAQMRENLQVYNPIRKKMQDVPEFDYLKYKSLRGDPSDNIAGFKGIGEKRATAMCVDDEAFNSFMKVEGRIDTFNKNKEMIMFHEIDSDDSLETLGSSSSPDLLLRSFEELGFSSLTGNKWESYSRPFYNLS